MEDIYCLWQRRGKGVPIAMNAVLAEKFDKNNSMPPMDYEWMRNKAGVKTNFPKKLWLIAKEKLLLFDYYPAFNGFIVSSKFLEIMKKNENDKSFQVIPLETISSKMKMIKHGAPYTRGFVKSIEKFNFYKDRY